MKNLDYIKDELITVRDFPRKGINFYDITPIFKKPAIFQEIINNFEQIVNEYKPDIILGAESRGFLLAAPLSLATNVPLVLARKPNKLPRDVYQAKYTLEYGTNSIEIHRDDIKPGKKVLIVDDLLATGGTANAMAELVQKANGVVVGYCFLINLKFLDGSKTLSAPIYSILEYDN